MTYGEQAAAMPTEAAKPISAIRAAERRSTPRYKMAIPALLEYGDGEIATVTVFNMSLAGFACDIHQYIAPGTPCQLKLPSLPGLPRREMMAAKVARCNGQIIGCSFRSLMKPEELEPFLAEYQIAA